MNQIKYAANALLLVVGLAAVALFVNNLSFPEQPSFSSPEKATDVVAPVARTIVNVAGQNLFRENCQTCHALDKTLTGPSLRDLEKRGPWEDRANLIAWVKNPGATYTRFDYTKLLIEQFNRQLMPSFPQLSEAQIVSILDYLKERSALPMP